MEKFPEFHFYQTIKICHLDCAEDTVDFLKQLRMWERSERWMERHSFRDTVAYNQFFAYLNEMEKDQSVIELPNLEDKEKVLELFLQFIEWVKSNHSSKPSVNRCDIGTGGFDSPDLGTQIRTFLENFTVFSKSFCVERTSMENWIENLLAILPYPLTVIYDPYYVDRVYRDEFYRYYASKHFFISKNCRRLIFLRNTYSINDFLSSCDKVHQKIEQDLIGMAVLKPTGNIGRTLIDPFKILLPRCYVRTTKFEITVLGRIYSLNAFPSSGQDSEVMTCAEVNVWQIMEYMGTRYRDYKALLPGEMLDCLKNSAEISILPSDGLSEDQEAHVFMQSGLSPRAFWNSDKEKNQPKIPAATLTFEDILHIFVESGIPVLLNLEPKSEGDNHSITCIGHEYKDLTEEFFSSAVGRINIDNSEGTNYNLSIIPSWRQYNKYVFLEDHSVPYKLVDKNDLKFSESGSAVEWVMHNMVVPLHKHVFMLVEDAYEIFLELFKTSGNNIAKALSESPSDPSVQVVARVFLAASRAFKDFRIRSSDSLEEKLYYSQLNYPKFLWVCEYGTPEAYCQHKIQGEFVLDATSARRSTLDYFALEDSIITIRFGEVVTYRAPNDDVESSSYSRSNIQLPREYAMFEQNNLKQVNMEGGRHNNV